MLKLYKVDNVLFTNTELRLPIVYLMGKRLHTNKGIGFKNNKESVVIKSTKDIFINSKNINIDISIFDQYNIIDIIAYSNIDEYRERILKGLIAQFE